MRGGKRIPDFERPMMKPMTFSEVITRLRGKRIAIVGSAPSCVDHEAGFIDSHDVVIRINNFKVGIGQGLRTDVHYSFYGTSIKTSAAQLSETWFCMCKCPDDKPIESPWHEQHGKQVGIDFRYIYRNRASWWPCPVYIPDTDHFLHSFELLDEHIPTTGFAAILDVAMCRPQSIFLTGFDFFTSGMHNVNERWQAGDPADPICHRPDLEAAWIKQHAELFIFDKKLTQLLAFLETA